MINLDSLQYSTSINDTASEQLSFSSRCLVGAAKCLMPNGAGLKLQYYEKLLNFVRTVSIYCANKNNIEAYVAQKTYDKVVKKYADDRIMHSLIDLLFHFKILVVDDGIVALSSEYMQLINKKEELVLLFEMDKVPSMPDLHGTCKKVFDDYLFVKDVLKRYRDPSYEFHYITKSIKRWQHAVDTHVFDYEIRLCETLSHLYHLQIPHKIASPFDEDYYTESGRNAFKNFTQHLFVDFIKELSLENKKSNVLDVGCGYGNYIAVIKKNFPEFSVTGLELQKSVCDETSTTFKSDENIEVLNENIFDFSSNKTYDFILLNYVFFYFNYNEKEQLLHKLKSLLSENGSIVMCQYFVGIEDLKYALAKKNKDLSAVKRIEMFYSNKILYANSLWNDCVDSFSESAKWDELLTLTAATGLKIENLTPADPFYYSLFVEIKAK